MSSNWFHSFRITAKDILRGFVFLFLFLYSVSAFSQKVKPDASTDSTHYLIGDYINLHLKADHQPGVVVIWNNNIDTGIGKFHKIKESKVDTQKFSYGLSESKIYTLQTFDTGLISIPPVAVFYKDESGKTDTVYTDSIPLHVYTIPVDTTREIKPIKGVLNAPFNWKDALPYIIAIVLFLTLVGLGIYLNRRKIKLAQIKLTPPQKVPHEAALEKLKKLADEKLWQNDVKGYYVQLTEILREYIEKVFKVPALENTTDEIIDSLNSKTIPTELLTKLNNLLVLADFVKFAKAKPVLNDHLNTMEEAVNFVNATKPATNKKEVKHAQ